MVYRYLRTLEGVTPPLSLTHLSCQITAKAFVATRTRAPLPAPCSTLTPSLSNSFRPNVLAGATWQRAQHDPARSSEWYRRTDRSEAPLSILYSETGNGPSHKAVKRDINGHFLIKTSPVRWGSPHQPHQTSPVCILDGHRAGTRVFRSRAFRTAVGRRVDTIARCHLYGIGITPYGNDE